MLFPCFQSGVLALCCARLITLPAKRCTYSRGVTRQHLMPGSVTALELGVV